MTVDDGRAREPGAAETLRGALLILAAGAVLGVAWNALGLASRPPYGLAWIARPPAPAGVAVLPPAPLATPPDTVAAPAPRSGPIAARGATPTHPGVAAAPVEPPPPAPPVAPPQAQPLTIQMAAFKQLYDAGGALVVDARESSQYEEGHVAGAISLPFNGALADPERVKRLDAGGRPFVVYCSGRTCELSMDLARFMVESGKRQVLVFEGGFSEWEAAGYAVARGAEAGSRP